MKVMVVVTHLLGTGHLSRALTLGRAFARAGHDVRVVSGGMPAGQLNTDAVDLVQLPPLRSDGVDFSRLLTAAGDEAGDGYLSERKTALLDAFVGFAPDVLITELFPFGRRSLKSEFLALLAAARTCTPRPLTLCSIRDILAPPSKPAKADETDRIVTAFYDAVLVHADPAVTPLEVSWPVSTELAAKLHYTGYVAPPPPSCTTDAGAGEILVSAGGGTVGQPIFRAAIETARKMTNRRWRLLVGGMDAAGRIAELRDVAQGAPVIVEPARPDFRAMLCNAAASVSMCGYNTALDLLQAGTPSVLIPFDDGKEVEQGLRARALSPLPGFAVVDSADLSVDSLMQALGRVLDAPARDTATWRFDGAAETVRLVERMGALR